jgi:hypothetical protein
MCSRIICLVGGGIRMTGSVTVTNYPHADTHIDLTFAAVPPMG